MARAPKTFNFFINQPLVRKLSEKHIGMVDLPLLSVPSLQQQMVGHRSANMTLEQLEALNAEQKARTVLVVQDPFTSYYDAQVVADFVRLVEKLGFQPVLLPFSPNGKAQHIKGFLNRFAKTAKKTADFLNRMAKLGMPMVGVDPALVLCYRDEYKLALGEERGEFNVLLANEWLASALESQPVATVSGESWYFFGHCTEVTALPGAPAQWAAIFARFGAKLENVSVGCCGMAGTYGHEAKNHKNSLGIYELSWHQAMQRLPRNRCLATGYSCRSQVKRVEGTGYAILCRLYWRLLNDMETKNHPGSTECYGEGNMVGLLDIRFEHIGDDTLEATMPVDSRTKQPFGLLHGGASVVLAESIGSVAVIYVPRVSKKWLVWKSMLTTSAQHEKGGCAAYANRCISVRVTRSGRLKSSMRKGVCAVRHD